MSKRADESEPRWFEPAEGSMPIGLGLSYEQMPVGFRYHSLGRTITEYDLEAFINLTWFTEQLFANTHNIESNTLKGRVVPANLLYCFAEGLTRLIEGFGQAFLGSSLNINSPSFVGDTIYVRGEVIEARPASRGNRGLLRTRNEIVNQKGEIPIVYEALRLVSMGANGVSN